jgi:hypothetical protein
VALGEHCSNNGVQCAAAEGEVGLEIEGEVAQTSGLEGRCGDGIWEVVALQGGGQRLEGRD